MIANTTSNPINGKGKKAELVESLSLLTREDVFPRLQRYSLPATMAAGAGPNRRTESRNILDVVVRIQHLTQV